MTACQRHAARPGQPQLHQRQRLDQRRHDPTGRRDVWSPTQWRDFLRTAGTDAEAEAIRRFDFRHDVKTRTIVREGDDLAVTMDVGHLMLRGESVPDHLARYGTRLAVVHLHGLRDGVDHQDLGAFPKSELEAILHDISEAGAPGPVVVTLEVFGPESTPASLEALAAVLDDGQGSRMARAARAVRAAAGTATNDFLV